MRNKKIVFESTDEHHARMLIRLRYDSLTQGDFFRGIVRLYIDNDENLLYAVDKIKETKSTMGKKKRASSLRDSALGETLLKDIGLSSEEEKFIYDIIEEDFDK